MEILGPCGHVGVGRSAVLTTAGAIFLFLILPVYSQNLVQNGNFDAGGGSFEGWQVSHSVPSSSYSGPTIASPGFNSNPYYARFNFEWSGGGDTLSQEIATTAGAVYDISFWAEDGAGHDFGAEFNFGSFSYNLLPAFAIGPGEWYNGWTNFNFDVTASELNTLLSFDITADTGSEFGLDDIKVVQVPVCCCAAEGTKCKVTVTNASSTTLIMASTNMVNWVAVCTNTPPFTYTDCASIYPRRFYRAAVIVNNSPP